MKPHYKKMLLQRKQLQELFFMKAEGRTGIPDAAFCFFEGDGRGPQAMSAVMRPTASAAVR